MSDESKTSQGAGTRKRRRRRRKPGGDRSATPSSAEGATERAGAKRQSGGNPDREKSGSKAASRKRRSRRRGGRGDDAGGEQKAPSSAKAPPAQVSAPRQTSHAWANEPETSVDPDLDDSDSGDEAVLQPGEAAWGDDSGAETPDIRLAADLPKDVSENEWDPSSVPPPGQASGYEGQLSARVANVIAVRFVPAGRLYLYDGGDDHFQAGDRVLVEGEHGKRIATVGTASVRKPPKRSLKRILRRANPTDASPDREIECREHLRAAKDIAKKQGLAIKVFRAQFDSPKKLSIYYSCENKTDVRGLSRAISKAIPVQVDLRHAGARDEAKLVGGIGSCGQELCCSTWLPAFVPVSIKNAKEQGLVLNPTKVSGQCGRLKCCLVYEQALYSEMRKGLPKLGKRVITNDGLEGRVTEVDVLHQRIRVSVGRGESKVYGKGEVEPMFASQPQPQNKGKGKKRKGAKGNREQGGVKEPTSSEGTPPAASRVTEDKEHDKE